MTSCTLNPLDTVVSQGRTNMSKRIFWHSLHRELWDWLADNPRARKNRHPKRVLWSRKKNVTYYKVHDCFACVGIWSPCICPLLWGFEHSNKRPCLDSQSPYTIWSAETNRIYFRNLDRHGPEALECISMARKIRDLPFNPKNIDEYTVK